MIVLALVGVLALVAFLVFLAVIGFELAFVALVVGGVFVLMAAFGGTRSVRR